ncbi:hypothetical protein [Streptosporangium subroseum]|uniref:hypothetical protein n=1 Tax=Streptosporangium subroseum TaxID=106412 RepID=UPI0030891A75|nr:hypothetical protein OHB15_28610 [Streptosporangium subroseum]
MAIEVTLCSNLGSMSRIPKIMALGRLLARARATDPATQGFAAGPALVGDAGYRPVGLPSFPADLEHHPEGAFAPFHWILADCWFHLPPRDQGHTRASTQTEVLHNAVAFFCV